MDKGEIAFWMSAVLAAIKLYEFVSDRWTTVTVDSSFVGLEEIGNTLTVLNKSKHPLTVSYYELVWVERRKWLGINLPFTRKEVSSDSPEDPATGCDIHLKPHEPYPLVFCDEYYFDWGASNPYDIYLKVWFVGRKKPKWFWVTGPRKYRG
ncbi:hypothetical protein LRC39_15255 [Rhodopseudomonas sp. P1]|uniref:hypothetical protein n=1 Tax=Rhodopseudomonas TaxID=1073 RepID=UPI0022F12D7C|nr:hypothetical protein [Rhodopseudomonas palustris]WBU28169.1 hypothetical protein OOZ54_16035 [Rhodopseudomonas palustris]